MHLCVGYVKDWVSLGAVQPFDPFLLSHFGQLNPALVQAGQVDGKQYFIPADWGFSAPVYRADKVDPKEDSWNLLYDGNPKEGRLSWVCGFVLLEGTKNYRHAHAYVDAWISPETAVWTLENYAYGHANTAADLAKVDPALVKAFDLEDPNILAEPRTHTDRWIPRRRVYDRVWDEVKAA